VHAHIRILLDKSAFVVRQKWLARAQPVSKCMHALFLCIHTEGLTAILLLIQELLNGHIHTCTHTCIHACIYAIPLSTHVQKDGVGSYFAIDLGAAEEKPLTDARDDEFDQFTSITENMPEGAFYVYALCMCICIRVCVHKCMLCMMNLTSLHQSQKTCLKVTFICYVCMYTPVYKHVSMCLCVNEPLTDACDDEFDQFTSITENMPEGAFYVYALCIVCMHIMYACVCINMYMCVCVSVYVCTYEPLTDTCDDEFEQFYIHYKMAGNSFLRE
jgi:hypothetical protein